MSESKSSSGYYARIMGTFWRHPRTSGLSLAARGLWVSLLSWCADQRTDGAVPLHVVAMVCSGKPDAKALAELEVSGLVTKAAGGLELRNWSKHNITRERHEREKERARNGMRDKRSRSPDVTRNKPVSDGSVSEQEQEQEHSTPSGVETRARAPEAPARLPAPEADPVESALRAGYGRRYASAAGDAWMSHAKDLPSIQRAAAWCRAQPAPMEAVERFLDGAFGHPPWARQRWPWKWLAEDPALTASRSSIAVGAMGTHSTLDEAMAAKLAAIPTIDTSDFDSILY